MSFSTIPRRKAHSPDLKVRNIDSGVKGITSSPIASRWQRQAPTFLDSPTLIPPAYTAGEGARGRVRRVCEKVEEQLETVQSQECCANHLRTNGNQSSFPFENITTCKGMCFSEASLLHTFPGPETLYAVSEVQGKRGLLWNIYRIRDNPIKHGFL